MTNTSDLDGLFKEVYAKDVNRLVPESDLLAKLCPFVPDAEQEGKSYNMPVLLTHEHGATYNSDGSAFTLLGDASGITKNASVNGTEFVLQITLSYGAMQKALKSGGGKGDRKRAFHNATVYQVKNATESASKKRELELLYGAGTTPGTDATGLLTNWGEVATETDEGASGTGSVTLTAASWATGIWAGAENAKIGFFDSDGTERTTSGDTTVVSVDPSSYEIQLAGTEAQLDAIVTGDYIFPEGARTLQMEGAFKVAQNTGSLHGISAATYNLWKGSSFAVGGSLTFAKIMQGLNRPASLGCQKDMCVLVGTDSWQDINEDQAALRRYAGANNLEVKQGSKGIEFFGVTGSVEIKPYIYMKRGAALALPKGVCKRVGATDITFEMPNSQGKIFTELATKAGSEFRCYYNQSFFCPNPAWMVAYTGIVPTAAAL